MKVSGFTELLAQLQTNRIFETVGFAKQPTKK
jgi:hypothetical protein